MVLKNAARRGGGERQKNSLNCECAFRAWLIYTLEVPLKSPAPSVPDPEAAIVDKPYCHFFEGRFPTLPKKRPVRQ
jgi:hypothetical protein